MSENNVLKWFSHVSCVISMRGRYRSLPFGLSSSVYQAVEARGSISETTRSTSPYIPRRYSAFKSVPSRIGKGQMLGVVSTAQTGFCSESEKVNADSLSGDRISGFVIDSGRLSLSLPPEKVTKIQEECRQVLQQRSVRVCQLSHLIGMLTATILAVLPAPLHYRHLHPYITDTCKCKSELKWWFRHLQDWNGKSLISPSPDLVITTDSSMMGWGAVCNGTTTQGLWSPSEKLDHINVLELKAAMFAVI